MLNKFKKWRNDLTYKQLEKILVVVGIIIAIVYVVNFFITQPWKNSYWWEGEIPVPIMGIVTLFFLEFAILMLIWLLLGGINKSSNYKSEQIEIRLSEKFKGDELIEVYFRPGGIIGGAEEIFSDPYKIYDLRYFARKENDEIIVTLMTGGRKIKDYPISNWNFFEANFKFAETKEKE